MEADEISFKQKFGKDLLTLLLNKYEQSQSFVTGTPGKMRPQLIIGKSPFARDYNDEMDFRKRHWMNERLAELEQEDVVQLTMAKYRSDEIEKVYLQWEAVEEAYRISGRTPLRTKLEQLRASLIPLSSHPWRWVQKWRQEMDDALAQGKAFRLDPDDVQGTVDLVHTLNELPLLGDRAVPIRIFSQQLFRDTKHLERQTLKRLIALAKQASGEQRETEEEWLDWLGLTRNPQSVFLCGSLVFRTRISSYTSRPTAGSAAARWLKRISILVLLFGAMLIGLLQIFCRQAQYLYLSASTPLYHDTIQQLLQICPMQP